MYCIPLSSHTTSAQSNAFHILHFPPTITPFAISRLHSFLLLCYAAMLPQRPLKPQFQEFSLMPIIAYAQMHFRVKVGYMRCAQPRIFEVSIHRSTWRAPPCLCAARRRRRRRIRQKRTSYHSCHRLPGPTALHLLAIRLRLSSHPIHHPAPRRTRGIRRDLRYTRSHRRFTL